VLAGQGRARGHGPRPAQDIAEQIAAIPDVTYVLTGTGRFDVIAATDTSSEMSLLRPIEHIRALRGVQRAGGTCRSSRKATRG
jgi:hypothetical protein